MSMEAGPTNTTESQSSSKRDKASQFVVVDLGKSQPTEQVNALCKGQGKLVTDVERIVKDLVTAGTIQSNAQPVVIVVRESSGIAIKAFDDSEFERGVRRFLKADLTRAQEAYDRHVSEAKVVDEGEHEDDESKPSMESFERGVRRFLKADLIRAQEAYDRHVKSASSENREAKVVDEGEHEDDESKPSMESFERGVRRFLKADLIRAQKAYDRHVRKEVERDTREGTEDEHEREEAKREDKTAGA